MDEEHIEIVEFDPQFRAIASEVAQDSIPPERQEEFINLIRTIVASIYSGSNIPPGIEFDDLVGFGYEGLIKAWRNYKNDKGAVFKTYATYRIRGEILDYIRKEWKSRNPAYQRRSDKDKEVVVDRIQELAGDSFEAAEPQNEEERAEVLQNTISNTAMVYLLSLENIENVQESLKKEDVGNEIINRIERTNERVFLADAIAELKDEEQKLVKMYYYEGKNQIEISRALEMSKSKVSRLHMKVLEKLKHKMSSKLNKEWSI